MKRYLAGALAGAIALAGCGGGGGGTSSSGGTTTIKVGVLPISDVAPLYLGMKKGFFSRQHLVVQPQPMQGGAAVVAGVVGGSQAFGFSATEPLMVAKQKNLPVKIVTTGNQASKQPAQDWSAIMVSGKSPVHSQKDLAGKTIATNALKNTNQLAALALLKGAGVDVSSVKWIEVAFPDMPVALASGRVDAATPVEPFVTLIKKSGGRMVSPLFAGVDPGMTIGTYFTTDKRIQQDPQLVRRFAKAMNRSLDYAQGHPDEARAVIKTYTKIPPAAVAKINLPLWSSDLNRPSIQLMGRLASQFGYTSGRVDVGRLIWSGAAG